MVSTINTLLLVPDADCLILSQPWGRRKPFFFNLLFLTEILVSVWVPHAQHYIHDSVDGCICSQAEVSSGDVVADGGWDDTHGDAQLLVVSSGFKQLQNTFIPLQRSNKERTLTFSVKVLWNSVPAPWRVSCYSLPQTLLLQAELRSWTCEWSPRYFPCFCLEAF